MKKFLGILIVILVICSVSFAFTDFNYKELGEKYEEAMETLLKKEVIKGYPDGTFKPENNVTRAEAIKIIVTAFNLKLKEGSNISYAFDDVKGKWCDEYVRIGVSNGVIMGYEDGTYKPDNNVTLGEMVLMLSRVCEFEKLENESDSKSDFLKIWDRADAAGLFKGYLKDELVSTKPETRDNVVVLVYNTMEVLANQNKEEQKKEPEEETEKKDEKALEGNKTYFGIVESEYLSRGETFIEVDVMDVGLISLQVVKLDAKPEMKSLLIFTPRKTGKIKLDKEFKITDLEQDYLLVEEQDKEVIAFKDSNDFLDITENRFKLGNTEIKLFNYEFYFANVSENNDGELEFTDCTKILQEDIKVKKDDRFYFDTQKDILIIVRGLDVE